eukprot:scaffold237226_cov30-Tisochrysis_lutea.AAC.3
MKKSAPPGRTTRAHSCSAAAAERSPPKAAAHSAPLSTTASNSCSHSRGSCLISWHANSHSPCARPSFPPAAKYICLAAWRTLGSKSRRAGDRVARCRSRREVDARPEEAEEPEPREREKRGRTIQRLWLGGGGRRVSSGLSQRGGRKREGGREGEGGSEGVREELKPLTAAAAQPGEGERERGRGGPEEEKRRENARREESGWGREGEREGRTIEGGEERREKKEKT